MEGWWKHRLKTLGRSVVIYSQELVTGLAWLAFAGTLDEARLISELANTYPGAWIAFHVAWFLAGLFLIVAISRPKLFISAWAFSAVVSICTFVASIGILSDNPDYPVLFPITWALFILLSVTQAVRHYWQEEENIGT